MLEESQLGDIIYTIGDAYYHAETPKPHIYPQSWSTLTIVPSWLWIPLRRNECPAKDNHIAGTEEVAPQAAPEAVHYRGVHHISCPAKVNILYPVSTNTYTYIHASDVFLAAVPAAFPFPHRRIGELRESLTSGNWIDSEFGSGLWTAFALPTNASFCQLFLTALKFPPPKRCP